MKPPSPTDNVYVLRATSQKALGSNVAAVKNTSADQSFTAFDTLKSKQRSIRSSFAPDLGLRVHRSLSWLKRAEHALEDPDAAFIFFWISFNAAYAEEIGETTIIGERSAFDGFFQKLIELDESQRIYDAIWERFSQSIRLFLDNHYVFQPFWKHKNNGVTYLEGGG